MADDQILSRKADHLRIVAQEDVLHSGGTLLDCVQLVPNSLPELDLAEIDTTAAFFERPLAVPLMITSMTGGDQRGLELNHALAQVAAEAGIAFAVGSQRVMLRHPERSGDFRVRGAIPDGVLLSNIGGQQLLEYPLDKIKWLVETIDADGICVHLNPAHELAQREGDRNFRGIQAALQALCAELPGRVLVKEVGHGLSPAVVRRLTAMGVQYLDVAGAGGTSWTRVEARRAATPADARPGEVFGDWGIPTAAAVIAARRTTPQATLIASGGISSGLDIARALAIGADFCGIARPLLLAFERGGVPACRQLLTQLAYELKCAMLLTGSANLAALRQAPRVYTGTLAQWLDGLGAASDQGEPC